VTVKVEPETLPIVVEVEQSASQETAEFTPANSRGTEKTKPNPINPDVVVKEEFEHGTQPLKLISLIVKKGNKQFGCKVMDCQLTFVSKCRAMVHIKSHKK